MIFEPAATVELPQLQTVVLTSCDVEKGAGPREKCETICYGWNAKHTPKTLQKTDLSASLFLRRKNCFLFSFRSPRTLQLFEKNLLLLIK